MQDRPVLSLIRKDFYLCCHPPILTSRIFLGPPRVLHVRSTSDNIRQGSLHHKERDVLHARSLDLFKNLHD